jgi:RES domain-containing protein
LIIDAWRLIKKKYQNRAFDGYGAKRYGGRWNSIGVPLCYTSGSLALAALELLVNLEEEEVLNAYCSIPIKIPSELCRALDLLKLPSDWDYDPPAIATKAIGDKWVKDRTSLALRVPSSIIKEEFNYLINPEHPDIKKLIIGEPRPFDYHYKITRRIKKSGRGRSR